MFEPLLDGPPAFEPGPVGAFADFSAGGDESVFSICRGNSTEIADAWRRSLRVRSSGPPGNARDDAADTPTIGTQPVAVLRTVRRLQPMVGVDYLV